MLPIDPINLRYLTEAVQQDRQRELEQRNHFRQAMVRAPYAPLLAALGRGMIALGGRLQALAEPELKRASWQHLSS
jgi:hypothetical protein